MFKVGLIGLVGIAWLSGCGASTSNPSPGSDRAHGGAGSAGAAAGEAGDNTASGGARGLGGAEDSGGSGQVPIDSSTAVGFCQGYYAIVGELFTKCWGLPPTEAQAVVSSSTLCRAFNDSIVAKRLAFDASNAAACLSELRKAESCDGMSTVTAPDCVGVMTPLVPTGGACS